MKAALPFFSIIMPVYNGAAFLDEAINSVINQEFTNWELLIIDDGSTDHSAEIGLERSRDESRIRLLFHEDRKNQGVSASRNLGMSHSTGNWISFLDADDYWKSDKLIREKKVIDQIPEVGFIYSQAQFEGTASQGKEGEIFGSGKEGYNQNPFIQNLSGFHVHLSNVSIARLLIVQNQLHFKENMSFAEDTLFIHETLQYTSSYYLKTVTGIYRLHENSSCAQMDITPKITGRYHVYEHLIATCKPEYRNQVSLVLVKVGMLKIWRYFLIKPYTYNKLLRSYLLRTFRNPKVRFMHKYLTCLGPLQLVFRYIFKKTGRR